MNDRAWERLAAADRLLLYGLNEQAERAYAELLEDVPGSSEAAFGLARCALERGDESLALERAQTATRLNPRNDDARRLAQRLAEIIAVRTGTVPQQRARDERPSERAVFTRNKSMADHRVEESKRKPDT